ncbi:MAG: hypothetical protein EYC70_03775 [Planctomycetota bacterium]|nr:MAG: hypothetical protein EYC70_03775 [Planctomycetota bacterium]
MPAAHRPRLLLLLPLFAAALAACAAPRPAPQPAALWMPETPPAPTPPGDLSLEERIYWWEARIPSLAPEDRSDANLNLGELYVEAQRPPDARRAFQDAANGPLARAEEARLARGMALSYLLEEQRDMAQPYLAEAVAGLEGPQQEECQLLLDWLRGAALADASPLLLERMRPYFGARFPAPPPALAEVAAVGLVDIARGQWGARPTGSNHDRMSKIWRITVHHSAEPMLSDRAEATMSEVRRIQKNHQNHQPDPWADIGYHYLVDRGGRVVEGRPIVIQGAHAGGDFNRGNIGICLLGNFAAHPEDGPEFAQAQSPTPLQLQALEQLVDQLREKYAVKRAEVWPHNHFRVTECPGPVLERWVEGYRKGAPGLVRAAAP